MWDAVTGGSLTSIGYFSFGFDSLALSADGSLAALSSNGTAVLWDIVADEELLSQRNAYRATVSPDGAFFACRVKSDVLVWDVDTTTQSHTLQTGDDVEHLAFSADGGLLAASSDDGTVYFWDARTGELLLHLEYPGRDFAFSDDGQLLVTASSDGTVRLWGIGQP